MVDLIRFQQNQVRFSLFFYSDSTLYSESVIIKCYVNAGKEELTTNEICRQN